MQKRTMNQAVAAFRMKKGTVVGAAQLRNWPFMIAIASDASAAGCVPLSITEPPR
jgi:hypothetical protein